MQAVTFSNLIQYKVIEKRDGKYKSETGAECNPYGEFLEIFERGKWNEKFTELCRCLEESL